MLLAGKFRDSVTHTDTITDSDAKLNINSAENISKTDTQTSRVKPNYVGVAVVAEHTYHDDKSPSEVVTDLNFNHLITE